MTPRWLWFAPLAVLCLAVAGIGFRAGWQVSQLTESDAINAAAAQYEALNGAGRAARDCAARAPAQGRYWIVVTCQGADSAPQYFGVTRFGVATRLSSQNTVLDPET